MTTQMKLESKLRKVRDSDQFIQGVISFADTEINMQLILNYMEENVDCDDQDVSFLAFELSNLRMFPVGSFEWKQGIHDLGLSPL